MNTDTMYVRGVRRVGNNTVDWNGENVVKRHMTIAELLTGTIFFFWCMGAPLRRLALRLLAALPRSSLGSLTPGGFSSPRR